MARLDPHIAAHLEWIGFVRPTGLVVSAPALVRAQAILNRRDAEGQRLLQQCVEEREVGAEGEKESYLPDFRVFARTVLGWRFSPKAYAGTEQSPIPPELEVPLLDSGAVLRPAYAIRERDAIPKGTPQAAAGAGKAAPASDGPGWQLLVREVPTGTDFDQVKRGAGGIDASAHGYLERLLRGTGVPAGLLFNGTALRLVSAPRGENSGWIDFRVADMLQTAGRPISTALRLLLSERRLLTLPSGQRLTALLADSRKFQNEVSERLAEQVLHSLYELLRGFQAAHDSSQDELLRAWLADRPDEIYRALLTVVLRLVFLLYAEERDMLPHENGTYLRSYSLTGLYERLREDAALYPDTMDQRYGAWAQLLALFRMIHDGARSGDMRLPARRGVLFDPERYGFLEGLPKESGHAEVRIEAPLVPDGTIYRVLEDLLVLDGERISYRALDVEHVGSVYETMMGFRLETASGRSIAIKAAKKHGAPATVNLEELLEEPGSKRAKWLRDRTDRKLTDKIGKTVREATTLEALHAALDSVVDKNSTPDLVARGAMVLQPSEERRRSGSHYTPRELTGPIVQRALEPVLDRLRGENGKPPRPEQILDLKVCDPAVGSGAFLVGACRQLGDALVEAWHAYDEDLDLAGDDKIVFARRLVVRRCLYGVDRNPVAVDLTKLSLWLVTLARDQPFTFVDHTIRHGDSLVGLSMCQIEAFHWKGGEPYLQEGFEVERIRKQLSLVARMRSKIQESKEGGHYDEECEKNWETVQQELGHIIVYGNLIIKAIFEGYNARKWEANRAELASKIWGENQQEKHPVLKSPEWTSKALGFLNTFHWETEFPEVFQRENPGFDLVIGNPPFTGGKRISTVLGTSYRNWLSIVHHETTSNVDLSGHFFRRSHTLLRRLGTLGLIATNSIAQGATREGSLRWLCQQDCQIYSARRRVSWPKMAAVVVSVIHIFKGARYEHVLLDEEPVNRITAFLFHQGSDASPANLSLNRNKSYIGMFLRGSGFIFDDNKDSSSPLRCLREIIENNPRSLDKIHPYIGGKEVNTSPTHAYHRYVIDFEGLSEKDAREDYPDLMRIVENKVRPFREKLGDSSIDKSHKTNWWRFATSRPKLRESISTLERVIAVSRVGDHCAFVFLPTGIVFSDSLAVIASESHAAFCALQARSHEIWARFFGSSMKDDLRYTPSDCFETFPFPTDWETHPSLEAVGKAYYEFRAELMVSNNEGMTKTYNRFHDPYEDDSRIMRLRELHGDMDRAVLDAYGWTDIPTECAFLLDYEIDEEEWGKKKRPWRYRWPDEVRDEVLGRLLELNAQRTAEEKCSGAAAKPSRHPKQSPLRASGKALSLFP